jgi:hypothetical protein
MGSRRFWYDAFVAAFAFGPWMAFWPPAAWTSRLEDLKNHSRNTVIR